MTTNNCDPLYDKLLRRTGESLEDLISLTQLLRRDALGEAPEVLSSLREVFATGS